MASRGHIRNIQAVAKTARSYLRGYSSFELSGREYRFGASSLSSAWEAEYFFANEEEFYRDALDEVEGNDVFYDIGANIGCFTCLMAGIGAEVYAFEPGPKAVEEIEKNLDMNSLDAKIQNYALSDSNEWKPFEVHRGVDGEQRIVDDAESHVECKTADSLGLPSPDAAKIDVEGHEMQVLHGMEELLKEARPVLYIEAHGSENLSAVKTFLQERDYETELMADRVDGSHLIKGK